MKLIDSSKCDHNKLIRKKDLIWKCVRCGSFFTVKIQSNDKDYVWLKKPTETEVEKFIGSWWCDPDRDMQTPQNMIKNKIRERLAHLDFNLETIVHFDKQDLESYAKKIQETSIELKKWFYILHCFDEGYKIQKRKSVE